MENEIALATGISCHCKNRIKEYFRLSYKTSGVIGRRDTTATESKYMCSYCGCLYGCTSGNGFSNQSKDRFELAKKLFDTTSHARFVRSLEEDHVVILGKDGLHSDALFIFTKGDSCRVEHLEPKSSHPIAKPDPFHKLPFLVRNRKTQELQIVLWSPLKYSKVPLSKAKKKALISKASKNKKASAGKGIQRIDKTTEIMARNVDTLSTIKTAHSKPLPKNAIPAVVVIIPELGSDYRYYVPKDAVTFG
jgi:hypothetical protein